MFGCGDSPVRPRGSAGSEWGTGYGSVLGESKGGGWGGVGGLLRSCQRLVPEALESGR